MDFFSFSGEIQNIELERSVFHFSKKHLQLSLTGNLYAAVASKDCNLGTPSTDQFCGKPSRDGGGSQVAYVTFKEAQALDTALLHSVSVYHLAKRNFLICILPQLYSKSFHNRSVHRHGSFDLDNIVTQSASSFIAL
jgi:hypothetical protein